MMGGFEQLGVLWFWNQERLKLWTDLKALKTCSCSVLLHVDVDSTNAIRIRRSRNLKKKKMMNLIFVKQVFFSKLCWALVLFYILG